MNTTKWKKMKKTQTELCSEISTPYFSTPIFNNQHQSKDVLIDRFRVNDFTLKSKETFEPQTFQVFNNELFNHELLNPEAQRNFSAPVKEFVVEKSSVEKFGVNYWG